MKTYTLQEAETRLDEARSLVILHNGEVYKYFDEGTTRFVYVNEAETKVLKIEKRKLGHFNVEESEIYNSASEEQKAQMVETTLLERGFIQQPFVTPIKYGGKKLTPEEREFANACRGEVGWDNNGVLKCFDLSEFMKY